MPIDDPDVAGLQVVASPRKPTFLQQERWKEVQQAKLNGMSIRRTARELGIHRDTVRKYIDAESPPTRRDPIATTTAPSDPSQTRRVTFMLNFDSHKSGSRSAHVAHFTSDFYMATTEHF